MKTPKKTLFHSCGVLALFLLSLSLSPLSSAAQRFTPELAVSLDSVSDARLSPDGELVVFVVQSTSLEEDHSHSDLYGVPFSGGEPRGMTFGDASDWSPRFSPDQKRLAFLSDRDEKTQVWVMSLAGGEPFQLTEFAGGVSEFTWAGDGRSMVVVSRDPEPRASSDEQATPPPLVIRRLQFKRDGRGYLDERRAHLYVVDVDKKDSRQLTDGPYDDSSPIVSPDGSTVVFVSDRSADPDLTKNTDLFAVHIGGGELRRLTANPGSDRAPSFSPDGSTLAYTSVIRPERIWYATTHLATLDMRSDSVQILTKAVDRNIRRPVFSGDGHSIHFLVEDDGELNWARLGLEGGAFDKLLSGPYDVVSSHGDIERAVAVISRPDQPGAVFAWDGQGEPRQLSFTNRARLSAVRLADVEAIELDSDGHRIEGFVVRPPDFQPGRRYPTILWIHGGPVSQFSHRFNPTWQILAAQGYVVVSANPRGSSGYGEEFSYALWAKWGEPDTRDVLAAVDHVVAEGYADPARLGVGGWSYGGILTNYVITQSGRFKAAMSGASETNFLACYGTDHYQHEWELELGLPWENPELYRKLSPITYVNNITTPTLVMCGEKDWNVPLNQSEQLYQSLRRLGVETELVIYPGQSHGIRVPSYQKDRYERWIAWFDRYLKHEAPEPTTVKN